MEPASQPHVVPFLALLGLLAPVACTTATADGEGTSAAIEVSAPTSAYTEEGQLVPLDRCKQLSESVTGIWRNRELACGEMGGYQLMVTDSAAEGAHYQTIGVRTPNFEVPINLFAQTDAMPLPHVVYPEQGGYVAKVAEWRGPGVRVASPGEPFSGRVQPTALILRYHTVTADAPYGAFSGRNDLVVVKLTEDNACVQSVISGSIPDHNQLARDAADSQAFHDFQCARMMTPRPIAPAGCGALQPGTGIAAGEVVSSCSGSHSLVMQDDGNLVLYDNGAGRALWASNTAGTRWGMAVNRRDGELVVYDYLTNPVFSLPTAGNPGSVLAVQDDGNLVAYAPSGAVLWASNTAGR